MWYSNRWWSENTPISDKDRSTDALHKALPASLQSKFQPSVNAPAYTRLSPDRERASPTGTRRGDSPNRGPGAERSLPRSPAGYRRKQTAPLPPLLPSRELGASPQRPRSRGGPLGAEGAAARPWTTDGAASSTAVGAFQSRRPTLTPAGGSRPGTRERLGADDALRKAATGGRVKLRSAALLLLKKGPVRVAEPPEALAADAAAATSRYSDELLAGADDKFVGLPPPPGLFWHAYLCHSALNGVDQAIIINQAFTSRCAGVKLCLRYSAGQELTAREVRDVVPACAALVLILTVGVLARPDVQVCAAPPCPRL